MISEREAFVGFVSRIGKEGGLILLLGCCAFLMLSLLSFESRDPGWSHLGYGGTTSNLAGPAGAWLADFSYSILGFCAVAPPLMLAYRSLLFLRKKEETFSAALPFLALRLLGALLFVFAGAALASLHIGNSLGQMPFSAGGVAGLSLAEFFVSTLGLVGATLVTFTLWMIGLTLFSDFSWFKAADFLGSAVFKAFDLASARISQPKAVQSSSQIVGEAVIDVSISAHDSVRPAATPTPGLSKTTSLLDDLSSSFSENREKEIEGLIESESFNAIDASVSNLSNDDFEEMTAENFNDYRNRSDTPKSQLSAAALENKAEQDQHVKIVPLSETVQPLASDDAPLGTDKSKSLLSNLTAKNKLPALSLLDKAEDKKQQGYSSDELEAMSSLLELKLKDFGVIAQVVEVNPGPVITRFEIQPAPGTKVSKISNLAKDLARSMTVMSVRVVEVIAGKSVVGIEIPNEDREIVRLSEVFYSKVYKNAESKLSLGLGNDIAGNPVVVNLAKMPHLLVAGTTGSGKSVGVNAMLLSLLYKATPDEVRLMMVDPKMLELSIYDGIPHLLTPVITDMKEAASGLRWCVAEMERRYKVMAKMGVRNLAGFNDKITAASDRGEPILDPLWNPIEEGFDENAPAPALQTLPYIVVVIDEFADMMMIVGKKVEELIARIAQKARAAGIHLILATQRPSVDVITGLIKANIPTRIAFQVSSKIDSRTVLDQSGAENLLGHGDMLYLPAGSSMPVRVHGAFVADDEVHRVVEAWKKWGPADFVEEILMANVDADTTGGGGLFEEEADSLYDEAVAFVTQSRRASISAVQRKLKIGYNRAARMVESMEAAGVVSEAGHNGSREVLAPPPVSG